MRAQLLRWNVLCLFVVAALAACSSSTSGGGDDSDADATVLGDSAEEDGDATLQADSGDTGNDEGDQGADQDAQADGEEDSAETEEDLGEGQDNVELTWVTLGIDGGSSYQNLMGWEQGEEPITVIEGEVRWYQWSPNGELILYEDGDNRELKVYDVADDTTHETGFSGVATPLWSPNSGQIAFMTGIGGGGTVEVHALDWDDTESTVVDSMDSPQFAAHLRWSPNSEMLAYTILSTTTLSNLFVADIDEGTTEQINPDPTGTTRGGVTQLTWAPGSDAIAYTSRQTEVEGSDLYIATLGSSSAPLKLTDLGADGSAWMPTFNAAGDTIWFVGTVANNEQRAVFTVPADTAAPVQLSQIFEAVIELALAPGEDQVSFLGAASDQTQLYIADPDTANQTLTPVNGALGSDGYVGFPDWQPAGDKISYFGEVDRVGFIDAYVYDSDGAGTAWLSEDIGSTAFAVPGTDRADSAWSSSGGHIAFVVVDPAGGVGNVHSVNVAPHDGDPVQVFQGGSTNQLEWRPDTD